MVSPSFGTGSVLLELIICKWIFHSHELPFETCYFKLWRHEEIRYDPSACPVPIWPSELQHKKGTEKKWKMYAC